jgi:hypothetical protein
LAPTSTPPATVGVDVCPAHETNQATGQTEPRIDTGEVDALLRFVKQPSSPGTSQLLGKLDAIQEGLARHVDAQALAGTPSSSIERSLSPETTALIFQAMQAYMDNAPAPQANIEALADMPSSSVQQQRSPETRTATKRSTSPAAGIESRAGFMSPPRKLVCVRDGERTPEARNRLELANGKTSHFCKMQVDDLRALRDALGGSHKLDVAEWARSRSLNSDSLRKLVQEGELAPEIQNRSDVADGKAPSFRHVGVDDLRALRDALAHNSKLDTIAWARARSLNSYTVRSLVRNGTLRPEAWKRLQNAGAESAIRANVDGEPLRQ